MSYLPQSESDRAAMLTAIGVKSVERLFRDIPRGLRATGAPDLPGPMAEGHLLRVMQELARQNRSLDELVCFAGGGVYDRFVPSIVLDVINRPEFKTGYTPYQPEASQGILQALFEYQSMICELTGMAVANASLYDGASALGEALLLAAGVKKRSRALVSLALSPNARAVAKTYCSGIGLQIDEVPYVDATGQTDLAALEAAMGDDVCCVAVQQPNYFGVLEDMDAAAETTHGKGGLFVAAVEPISLGLLKPPGEYGADMAVGEGQPLGVAPGYGGPLLGIFACQEEMVRQMPGRVVGETVDADGERAYCLTLQTREQHIRREKATSNICTSESLCALASAVYLAALGPQGLREVAERGLENAHFLAKRLSEEGVTARPRFAGAFFNELTLDVGEPSDRLVDRLVEQGYLVGPALGRAYPELANCLLVAATEQRTWIDVEDLVAALGR